MRAKVTVKKTKTSVTSSAPVVTSVALDNGPHLPPTVTFSDPILFPQPACRTCDNPIVDGKCLFCLGWDAFPQNMEKCDRCNNPRFPEAEGEDCALGRCLFCDGVRVGSDAKFENLKQQNVGLSKEVESLAKELKTSRDYAAALSHDLERLHGENARLENQYHALRRDYDRRLREETFAATRKLTAEHEVAIGRLEGQLGLATDTLARHRAWEVRLRSGVRRGCAITAAGLSLAVGAHYGGPYVVQGWHALAARIPAEHTATVQSVGSLVLALLFGLLGWALSKQRQRRQRATMGTVHSFSGPGISDTVRVFYDGVELEEVEP